MKKLLVLAAALLLMVPASAMAGMTAFMNMDELSSNEMASTTGQAGLTISGDFDIADGQIGWGDSDGFGGTYSAEGWVTLHGLHVTQSYTSITVDVGTDAGDTDSWIGIDLGTPLIMNATIDAIYVGDDMDTQTPAKNNIGEIRVNNLTIADGHVRIKGH